MSGCLIHAAFWLLAMQSVMGQTDEEIVRAALDATYSTSHLPQVARSNDYPYPHSETYESFRDAMPRPCGTAQEENYRRADAVCNNLRHPFQGAALDTERRLFSNSYLDGKSFPKILGRDGRPLPSAREVSIRCFGSEEDEDGNGKNRLATQMVWQFGQILAHDVTHVEKVDGSNECCQHFDPNRPHADLYTMDRQHCFPIAIPRGDPHFNNTCLPFSRTYAVDVFGVREPINAVTSYLDLSTVYGSSEFHQGELRLGIQGLLKTFNDNGEEELPRFGSFPCTTSEDVPTCPVGGDIRVSDQAALGAMHTLFHFEHNRIAKHLFSINPFWDDERLFQEARKIFIGIIQKIVYKDYLPLLVGNDVMKVFSLEDDFVYDDTVDPGAILEFSTTGLRYGHTLINTHVNGFELRDLFLEPVTASYLHFEDFPFFQSSHTAHEFNNLFTNEIREHLFEGVRVEGFTPVPSPSFDLMALNVQRGRDHGIAPYIVVRDACLDLLDRVRGARNETPACFADGVYRHAEDIELFVGGMSEKPLHNAVLGPTFACMAALQFQRLKFGDRFFYTGTGPEGFTKAQREFLDRNTLASLICELDSTRSLQRDAFRPASDSNPRVPCETILRERKLHKGLWKWADDSEGRSLRQTFTASATCDRN